MVGYIACSIITLAYLPQCYRIWKHNSVEGLSIYTFGAILIAMVLWIIHAVVIKDIPLLLSSLASLIQNSFISYKIIKN